MYSRLTVLATLLSLFAAANGEAHPDYFHLSLDKDLRLFGVGKRYV